MTGTWGLGYDKGNDNGTSLVLFDSNPNKTKNKLHADKGLRKTGLNQVEQIKLLWNL